MLSKEKQPSRCHPIEKSGVIDLRKSRWHFGSLNRFDGKTVPEEGEKQNG